MSRSGTAKPNQPLSFHHGSSPAGWNISSAASGSVAIGRVRVVGDPRPPVVGGHDDLFTAVAAGTVLPHHRLQHQRLADREDEVVVELLAQIGSDHGSFGRVVPMPWPR